MGGQFFDSLLVGLNNFAKTNLYTAKEQILQIYCANHPYEDLASTVLQGKWKSGKSFMLEDYVGLIADKDFKLYEFELCDTLNLREGFTDGTIPITKYLNRTK